MKLPVFAITLFAFAENAIGLPQVPDAADIAFSVDVKPVNCRHDWVMEATYTHIPFARRYYITAPIPGKEIHPVCRAFWKELTKSGKCRKFLPTTHPQCWDVGNELRLRMLIPLHCKPPYVHAAWWEATKNKYGPIHCQPEGELA
ncbi:hypothetical protein EsH8_I_000331 [Colletotrichum jinshuiense]